MGNTREALRILVEQLGEVELTMEFAREWDDAEIWRLLVEYALKRHKFLRGVLSSEATGYVDTVNVVRRMDSQQELDSGLREALAGVVRDKRLQMGLLQVSKKIFVEDCTELMNEFLIKRRRAVVLRRKVGSADTSSADGTRWKKSGGGRNNDQEKPSSVGSSSSSSSSSRHLMHKRCCACAEYVLEGPSESSGHVSDGIGGDKEGLVVFGCTHVYHRRCLSRPAGPSDNNGDDNNAVLTASLAGSPLLSAAQPGTLQTSSQGLRRRSSAASGQQRLQARRRLECLLCS